MNKSNKLFPASRKLNIFLAEDDKEDCDLFKEALDELDIASTVTIFADGEQLVKQLTRKRSKLPDVLFLDLNMPRKNGFATLGAIKRNEKLDQIPVIILSSAHEDFSASQVFSDAAHYYIRKPSEFAELKKLISKALTLTLTGNNPLPLKADFILNSDM